MLLTLDSKREPGYDHADELYDLARLDDTPDLVDDNRANAHCQNLVSIFDATNGI